MYTSEKVDLILAAILKAVPNFGPLVKSASNPHFKSRYLPLDGLVPDVRDESDTEKGIRIVLDLKRDGDPAQMLNALYRYTDLQMSVPVQMVYLFGESWHPARQPKQVGQFVNTWSIAGFHEEGVAPAEMGWGTHERRLPPNAHVHHYGPCNQICLAQMGMNTWVRSWVPLGGEIIGMVIRHGEAFTISDHLTVWENGIPVYRPTVHYAYLPTDAALASWPL